tara:strand:- start:28188 stop:28556 length:369 start_codon:yes stop_codon:yes gene_type:complete
MLLMNTFIFIRGFLIILLFLIIGKAISPLLPIVFPGSIIGLILLFLGLRIGVIKLEWVLDSANFIIKYMVILFIPLSVGIINYFDLLLNNWLVILCSIFFTSFLIMLSVGHLFQHLNKKANR